MPSRSRRIAIVWLATLCLVAQSVCAGIPSGGWLCIGCDGVASITPVACGVAAPVASDCCADDALVSDGFSAAVSPSPEDCGCLDVPLPSDRADVAARSQRAPTVTFVLAAIAPRLLAGAGHDIIAPAAGPDRRAPQAPPLARRTVLNL